MTNDTTPEAPASIGRATTLILAAVVALLGALLIGWPYLGLIERTPITPRAVTPEVPAGPSAGSLTGAQVVALAEELGVEHQVHVWPSLGELRAAARRYGALEQHRPIADQRRQIAEHPLDDAEISGPTAAHGGRHTDKQQLTVLHQR